MTGRRGRHPRRGRARDDTTLAPESMVFGRHPVREALAGQREVLAAHATELALRDLGDVLEGVPVTIVADAAVLDELAGSADHQGIIAEVEPFPYCDIDDLLGGDTLPLVLCLDQVTDPHNLGAIARVCDASGASGLLLPQHRSAHVTAAVCKASAGAIEHVRVAVCTNLADTILRCKGPRVWAYAATERGERDYTDADFRDGVLLVLGAEGAGVRPRVLAQCDEQVRIPMLGSVASLNVSTVAALLAYEAVRQRGASGLDGLTGMGRP